MRVNLDNCLMDYFHQKNLYNFQTLPGWKEQAGLLSEEEAIVDFIAFPHPEKKNETLCCALVFGKRSESPQIVRLCTKSMLNSILQLSPNEQLSALSDSVWSPIEKALSGGYTRLYLSLSDEFSNVPFSGIRVGHQYLTDKYAIHTVSSIGNINYIKNKKELPISQIPNFFLFGGADFGLPPQQTGAQTRGQGFPYLPGSKQEVDLIAGLLKNKSKNVTVYSGAMATKENLKSISDKQQVASVLHISTHGFLTPFKSIRDTTLTDRNAYSEQYDPLVRSGLALTGANHSWKKANSGQLPCDGIITSLELIGVNMWTTELVVLSACHSAKEEGVDTILNRGLQRALSLSGAHSLLASLWAIPDKESVEMMEEFYSQWLTGLTKREAFNKALLKMRNRYPTDPEKWAGFILME